MGYPTVCAGSRELKEIRRGLITSRIPTGGCSNARPIIWAIPKPRAAAEILDLSVPYFHRPCLCNEIVSLHNRVMSPPYSPNHLGATHIRALENRLVNWARSNQLKRLTWETFVDSITVPSKRRLYARALVNLKKFGFEKWMGNLSSFIKVEAQCGVSKGSADPRMIQARTPEYNIAFGCYFKPIEHLILELNWSTIFPSAPTTRLVAKGLNNRQRAVLLKSKWDQFEEPVCFDFDASRFDQSVSVLYLELCHAFYLALHGDSKRLREILAFQVVNHGITKNGVEYYGEGGRASGDQDTGGGNSLITVTLVIRYFMDKGIKYEFCCDGDDGVIMIERRDVRAMLGFVDYAQHMGFKMEVGEPATNFDHVNFCQCRPVELALNHWCMVRDPRRAISRMAMSHTSMSTIPEALQTLWAVGSCELALGSGVPVMQDVASWALRNGRKPSSKFLARFAYHDSYRYWHLPRNHGPKHITPFARASMAAAFDISIGEQLLLEKAFSGHNFDLECMVLVGEPMDAGAGPVSCEDYKVYKR